MELIRTYVTKLTKDELLIAVAESIKEYPEAVSNLLANGGKYGCPFPNSCKRFPCKNMRCNADHVGIDGYAYRMS